MRDSDGIVWPANTVCVCSHAKRLHWNTAKRPNGPCRECECRSFTPEPVCRCGHGKKAHAKGPCHEAYVCACRSFREAKR